MGGLCSGSGLCDEADELNCSGKEEVIPEPPLAGRWLSSRGKQHVIGLDAIQWASGETTPLRKLRQVRMQKGQPKRTEWAMDLKGNRYTAHLTEEGHLQWSDGDVWNRDFRAPETGTYAAVSGVLVKATESFHEALSNTPGAFSSAASVVASPLTSGWGGGKSAAGSPSSGQVPGEVVEGVSQYDRQSAMDQAYSGGPATMAQQQQRQAEFHVPPQAAPYGSGSAAAMPTQLVGGMQPGRPYDVPPGQAAGPPQGAPQGSPQYLQHGVPQASQQPQLVHVPSGPLQAQQGQQPMPPHLTLAPQQRVQHEISPQALPQASDRVDISVGMRVELCGLIQDSDMNGQKGNVFKWDAEKAAWIVLLDDGASKSFRALNLKPCLQAQLPMQAPAQPMQQPGPPVFPEPLSPESEGRPRPKRRVAPSPRPTM